eukprot:10652890-Karenia_brevis.AAC.1
MGALRVLPMSRGSPPIPSQYEGPMINAVVKVIWGQHRTIRSSGAIFSVLVEPLTCHPKFHHEWQ